MPDAGTADKSPKQGSAETSADSDISSSLHPKHQQSLLDAYGKADWLCSTLAENQYITVPSHLKSIRRSLRSVLTDQRLLEHLFVCTHCGYETWASENPAIGQKQCPDCDEPLEHANTRTAESDAE